MSKSTETDAVITDEARVAQVNESTAVKLAATYDETADVFKRASILATAAKSGATLAEVAARTTVHRVANAWKLSVEDAATELATPEGEKRARKQKLIVSKSSVQAYVSAWNAVLDAATRPTKETTAAMFRAKSTGGTADLIREVVAASQEAKPEDRPQVIVDGITAGLATLNAKASSKGRPNTGDDSGDAEGAGGGSVETTGFSLEGALHQFQVIAGQAWTEDEAAALAVAALQFAETISASVPVE